MSQTRVYLDDEVTARRVSNALQGRKLWLMAPGLVVHQGRC